MCVAHYIVKGLRRKKPKKPPSNETNEQTHIGHRVPRLGRWVEDLLCHANLYNVHSCMQCVYTSIGTSEKSYGSSQHVWLDLAFIV